MKNINKTLIKFCFPQFDSPPKSRFESLFAGFRLKDSKKCSKISYSISPDHVIQGDDKRTALVIKNIPKNVTKKEIRSLLGKYGNLNFLVIMPDSKFPHLIVAYLNVVNYKSVASIYMGLRKHIFYYFDKKYNIEINYSKVQGKENLKKNFSSFYNSKYSSK